MLAEKKPWEKSNFQSLKEVWEICHEYNEIENADTELKLLIDGLGGNDWGKIEKGQFKALKNYSMEYPCIMKKNKDYFFVLEGEEVVRKCLNPS